MHRLWLAVALGFLSAFVLLGGVILRDVNSLGESVLEAMNARPNLMVVPTDYGDVLCVYTWNQVVCFEEWRAQKPWENPNAAFNGP